MKKIAAKHAARISALFNTVAVNDIMIRSWHKDVVAGVSVAGRLSANHWEERSHECALELLDTYGITIPGLTERAAAARICDRLAAERHAWEAAAGAVSPEAV